MRIQNFVNAFLELKIDDLTVFCDPWVTPGIFDGGWAPFPSLKNSNIKLPQNSYVFISHIHEDHFDLAFIKTFPSSTTFLIPKVYPHHIIKMKLANLGFNKIIEMELAKNYKINEKIEMVVIPPMNSLGQEIDMYSKYQDQYVPIGVDAGLLVKTEDFKGVLLFDNTPYEWNKSLGSLLDEIKDADILAFPYNGAASDYPLCYENISQEEGIEIAAKREKRRFDSITQFIEETRPKSLLPFSSDFMVCGKQAEKFANFKNEWWFSRDTVAKNYQEKLKVKTFVLREGDFVFFQKNRIDLEKNNKQEFPYHSPHDAEKMLSEENIDLSSLKSDIIIASQNMFNSMDRFNLKSEWIFALDLQDNSAWEKIYIDLSKRKIVSQTEVTSRKILTCKVQAGYLQSILIGKGHWNNAQLSFQLLWERIPNIYDHMLYLSLNFFHLPKVKS